MLSNLVQESANNPGTSATVTLTGAVTGRRTFAASFSNGAAVYYFLDDGTQSEWGSGVVSHGPPAALSRTTVIGNSSGTLARLNFTGAVRVYCTLPAERFVYTDSTGALQGSTVAALRNAVGATATGAAVLAAVDQAAARAAISAARSGAVGSSDLTMNTARILGRTTASSGAVEEITVGSGLSLSGGVLTQAAQLREQLFTSSGTWTAPAGVTQVQLVVIAGGGGGGGYNFGGADDGRQGGFAGVAVGSATVVPGTAYTVTVGAGGTGGATSVNGTAGGTSSFGALMSATGGGGGSASSGSPSAAGTGSSGTIRNTNIGVTAVTPFSGSLLPRPQGSGAAATPWTISSTTAPGVPGSGAFGTSGSSLSAGGVGGVVYVQWVG